MGKQLFDQEPVFRNTIETCHSLINSKVGWSLVDVLYDKSFENLIQETAYCQPAIFSFQVALCNLLKSWGIEPSAVIGFSMGEMAASHIAGFLTLEYALDTLLTSSKILQTIAGSGSMVAVIGAKETIQKNLLEYRDSIWISAVNSNKSLTLAGDTEKLKEFVEKYGFVSQWLTSDVPFHCPIVEPVKEQILRMDLGSLKGNIPMYSTVTGHTVEAFDARYMWSNIRETGFQVEIILLIFFSAIFCSC
jgi:acyl transferase domain-containing protein